MSPCSVLGQNDSEFQRARENVLRSQYKNYYKSLVILGYAWSQDEVAEFLPVVLNLTNPWAQTKFENVFAFGVRGDNPVSRTFELLRVISDNVNYFGLVDTKDSKLEDAYIETLVAHSNGCDVAVNLIRQRKIHVGKLVLLAPPFGTAEEAKYLPVEELIIRHVEGDLVSELIGKGMLFRWFLKHGWDVNIGPLGLSGRSSEPGYYPDGLGFELRKPLGPGGSQPKIDEKTYCRSEGDKYIFSRPHVVMTILMNWAIEHGDAGLIKQLLENLEKIYPSEQATAREEARQKLQKALKEAEGGATGPGTSTERSSVGSGGRPSHRAVRSANDPSVGVEAGPVSAAMVATWAAAAAGQSTEGRLRLDDLLPTDALRGTKPIISTPEQTMLLEFHANAVDARAVDFRVDGNTVGVVLVTKTLREPYFHEYHVCPRFHGWALDDVAAVPLGIRGHQASSWESGWFWLCRILDDRSGMAEVGAQFVVLVNESRREMTIDSRWLSKQYCPYWRGERAGAYDYFLNFQVWSCSETETCYLVEAVLAKLAQLSGGNWRLVLANQEEPRPPVAFLEGAWLAGNVVQITAWNRLWTPCLAVFHGTKQSVRDGGDVFFEYWAALRPGRNVLQLPLGQIDNAVVHCEVDGFIDKVFVSVDKTRTKPLPPVPAFAGLRGQPPAATPQVKIAWPPSNAKVVVLRDQLDMPDDDDGKRLAINGTVAGAPPGSTVDVFVYTNDWYKQDTVVVREGLWGSRVRLSGQGDFNKHSIYVRLRDASGAEIAHDRVDGIVRFDSKSGGTAKAPVGRARVGEAPARQWNPIVVEAKEFQGDAGCHREANGVLIVGGGPDGPNGRGGSASCRMALPEDASAIKLRVSIWHGMETEFGKGVHSVRQGGTVTVYVNEIPVHTIVCRHRGMYGDFWPEQQPELGRNLPEIDLAAKGIKGRSLTIKIVASPWTCMDLRSIEVEPMSR